MGAVFLTFQVPFYPLSSVNRCQAAYKVVVYFYLAGYRLKKYFLLHEESFR